MKKRTPKGFTLIELLVATGVTVILVALMITIVSNLLGAYNRSSGVLASRNQASLVLEQLSAEIESLVVRDSVEVTLAATIRGNNIAGTGSSESEKPTGTYSFAEAGSYQPGENSLAIQEPPDSPLGPFAPIDYLRFGQGGTWLRFISSAPSLTNDDSGVRAIGYQIALNPVTSAPNAPLQYMMYRSEVSAQDTFDNGYELDPNSPDYNYNGTVLANPGESEIIAGNVIDFGVRLYGTNSNRERVLLFPLNTSDTEYFASGRGAQGYPRFVEVMVRILTPEGERLLSALRNPNVSIEQGWWEIVEEHSEVYSKVIKISSTPL